MRLQKEWAGPGESGQSCGREAIAVEWVCLCVFALWRLSALYGTLNASQRKAALCSLCGVSLRPLQMCNFLLSPEVVGKGWWVKEWSLEYHSLLVTSTSLFDLYSVLSC